MYTEANEFSAIFIQVKHYATKVSATDVEILTDKLIKYGNAVLGKETPFVTMVMLLGPGEIRDQTAMVHLDGACVHMVVRGLSPCSKFLSEAVQGSLNQCFASWAGQPLMNSFMTEYGFLEEDAKFATQGMDNADF